MNLLAPLAGLFGLVVPAIVALYFLKPRRPDVDLSSTFLWRRTARDRQASVPWQRLRPSWLLLLQVLGALLVVAALVRPARAVGGVLGGTTVVVVDASVTMQATDVTPSRFAVAKDQAAALIDRLSANGRMALVAMDARPRILVPASSDRTVLRRALAALRVTSGPADLQGALQVAVGAAGTSRGARLVLLSDGITEPLVGTLTLPFGVDYRPIGVSGENLAITALTVQSGQALVHVQNFGRQRHHTTAELEVGGRVVDARAVDLAAGTGQDAELGVPADADHVTASLVPDDVLTVDDTASVVVRPPRSSPVVVVTSGNPFLLRALALRDDIKVTAVTPASYRPDPRVGLYVFDRFLPPVLPAGPYLLVDPPPPAGTGAQVYPGRLVPAEADDPLLADVDLSDVHVARAEDLRASGFGRPVIESGAGPVLEVRDSPPAALLGFDLHESDLPLRAAFPILVRNLSEYLDPSPVPAVATGPGAPVQIAVGAGASRVKVTRPDGGVDVLAYRSASSTAVDADTGQVGLYRVSVTGPGGTVAHYEFAVNAGGSGASAIDPRRALALAGTATVPAASTSTSGLRELWPWLVAAALVVLLAEWVVFHRVA